MLQGQHKSRKRAIQQLHAATDPKFAVFLRTASGKHAQFRYLHDSLESAIECCRHFSSRVVADGCLDFTYYAVEIKHRVGIERGKPVDQAML
jgi:hypothetical protein